MLQARDIETRAACFEACQLQLCIFSGMRRKHTARASAGSWRSARRTWRSSCRLPACRRLPLQSRRWRQPRRPRRSWRATWPSCAPPLQTGRHVVVTAALEVTSHQCWRATWTPCAPPVQSGSCILPYSSLALRGEGAVTTVLSLCRRGQKLQRRSLLT